MDNQQGTTEHQIAAARLSSRTPDIYRLVRYRTEEGATHLKLQGYFTWTQGWSQRGGQWKDIETVDADDLSDDKPYGPLLQRNTLEPHHHRHAMTTDYRALCGELLDALENAIRVVNREDGTAHISTADDIVTRARAALAEQPAGQTLNDIWGNPSIYVVPCADLDQPEPVAPTDHDWLPELRGAFERILCVARSSGGRTVGNIELADRLIDAVVPVSQRWGHPAPQPIPVAERLPGPEDCDAEGRCWLWGETIGGWIYRSSGYIHSGITHWLPAHALPLPEVEG